MAKAVPEAEADGCQKELNHPHNQVAEAAQMETVRALIPKFEAKIQRVLDRVWGIQESVVILPITNEDNKVY